MNQRISIDRGPYPHWARRSRAVAWAIALLLPAPGAWTQVTTTPAMDHAFVEEALKFGGPGNVQLKPENRLQALDGMAAFVTRDSLYLAPLGRMCTLMICGNVCNAESMGGSAAIPLPGTREEGLPVFGLVRVTSSAGEHQVIVAVVRNSRTVHRMEIRLTRSNNFLWKGVVAGTRTLEFPGNSSASIRAIGALRKHEDTAAPGFLALGTPGMAYRIRESATGAMTPVSIEGGFGDFTACGQGWIGTTIGQIFTYEEVGLPGPKLVQRQLMYGAAGSIQRIDSLTGMTATGMALVRRGETWMGLGGGSTPYVGVHPEFSLKGTSLILYPADPLASPAIKEQSLGDAVSYLVQRNSLGAWTRPEREAVYEGSLSKEVALSLRDADGNGTAPLFRLQRASSPSPEDLASGFVQADPDLGCAATGHCLPGFGSPVRLILHPDSVILSIAAMTGTMGTEAPHCPHIPAFAGRDTTIRLAFTWNRGDSFTMAMGKDTVTWSHGVPSGILAGRQGGIRPGRAEVRNGAATIWRNGWYFDLAGRQIIPALP